MKNQNKNGKEDDNQTKKAYCLKPVEATEGSCNNGGSVSVATSTTENSDLPLARVVQCFVKTENILVQNPGEEILINEKSYVGVVDSCSNKTLCHPDVVPKEPILPNQTVTIKGISSTPVILPMAKVKINNA